MNILELISAYRFLHKKKIGNYTNGNVSFNQYSVTRFFIEEILKIFKWKSEEIFRAIMR